MSFNIWSRTITMVLIMAMFAMVDISSETEIIFPEISALALGFWVMSTPPWEGSGFAVWASPILAALTGILLLRYFPVSPFFLIATAFILVVIQLKLLRSAVFPSLSATILPILTHSTSWLYPFSVSVLMTVVVLGRYCLDRFHQPEHPLFSPDSRTHLDQQRKFFPEFTYWTKILAGVLAVTAVALQFHYLFMIAPPLIVVFVELSRPEQSLRQTPGKTLLLIVLAAGLGVFWLYVIGTIFHGPLWLFAGLSLLSVFQLYKTLQVSFPPAAAIALLPVLVPPSSLWIYPLHVFMGSSLFIFMGIFFFRDAQQKETA